MKRFIFLFLFVFVSLYSETNDSITNIEGNIVQEKRLPNIYLKTGSTNEESISKGRRFDAVYFIAVPVTYYVTFNLLQQKNYYLRKNFNLDRGDEFFLYFNTFFLPLVVAYFDYSFVQEIDRQVFKDSIFYLNFYIKEF